MHKVVVEEGTLTKDAAVKAIIDTKNRSSVVKNHTATHLLHQALKDVLGTHVNQAGSLVTSERLRFDFSHFGQVQADELEKIERMVNEKFGKVLMLRFLKSNRRSERNGRNGIIR